MVGVERLDEIGRGLSVDGIERGREGGIPGARITSVSGETALSLVSSSRPEMSGSLKATMATFTGGDWASRSSAELPRLAA
jgi:hypothetical protein